MKLSHVRSYLELLDRHVLGLHHQKRIEICACLCMRESTSAGIRQIKISPNFDFFRLLEQFAKFFARQIFPLYSIYFLKLYAPRFSHSEQILCD